MAEPQKLASQKREQEGLDMIAAYRQVFSTPQGEKVLSDLIKRHVLRANFSENSNIMAFKEGERSVVLNILAALQIDENQLKERITNVRKAT